LDETGGNNSHQYEVLSGGVIDLNAEDSKTPRLRETLLMLDEAGLQTSELAMTLLNDQTLIRMSETDG
jgi:hypothetical protein